ncbi:unnamed protein product [Caenorhabditis bovis]|uniref:Rab-GAP TBC domain-containing protein n=1 Tax=Caenorhabditis bovis TaxID=2654633 RepID=A0A8S1EVF0_9PELO|nr:unnamed protein product [Caenorhabditis bovis]
MPSSSSNSLTFDATSLVKYKLSDELLSKVALSGSLRSSSCRSAVWRLLLRCLPYDIKEWEVSLSRTRNSYRVLKKTKLIDPRDEKFIQDPQFNNPLAPVEQNPWNSFFEDNELRDIIGKDVARTFPEIEFFQQSWLQKLMADILLVFAKDNPYINYKQGMHEILAPLIFVIYSDIEAFEHAKEGDELKTLTVEEEDCLNCLFNKDFLEHDCFNLFAAFMLEISKWYEDNSEGKSERGKNELEPYLRVQDSPLNSRLMEDLMDIAKFLEETDPALAKHLSSLDIPPQLYGIRWLRLLFGRELSLHDLLFLWDVLLTDRPIGPLVKCIFVSLLVQIRQLLLSSDYGGCLQYLMRYPPIADMDSFIKLARHYRNPKKNARPIIKANNFSHITVSGTAHPNRIQRPTKSADRPKSKKGGNAEASPSILTFVPVLEKVKNSIRDRANSDSAPSSPRKLPSNANANKLSPKSDVWGKEIQLMEEQVSCLQIRLNEQEMVCSQVAETLEECADEALAAKSDEQREKLSEKIRDLSQLLINSRNVSFAQVLSKTSTPEAKTPLPAKIRQNNEMYDMQSSKRLQM